VSAESSAPDGYERERKFLVSDQGSALAGNTDGSDIAQSYLQSAPGLSVRVRLVPGRGWFSLTVKGPRVGMTRREAECAIERDVAELLYEACGRHVIDKTRYPVHGEDGMSWVVDVFRGANAGLVLAEIELPSETTEFARPPWCGDEVTDDDRYYNEYLAHHPFSTW